VAAVISQSVNILIIVQMLGHELYRSWMVLHNGFKRGPDLLGYLERNLSGYGRDDPQLAVEDFHLPWWRGSSAPPEIHQLPQLRERLGVFGGTSETACECCFEEPRKAAS